MWHCFCNSKATPEKERAPASQTLILAFVVHMAAAYSGKTISNYLHGVRAWHILHSFPWHVEKAKMDTMLRAADKLMPSSSKKKKRRPYTLDFIIALRHQMNLEDSLDAAVFACLTTCFYASGRLGEFTVQTLQRFNLSTHITRQNLAYDQNRNGLKVTCCISPEPKWLAAKVRTYTGPHRVMRQTPQQPYKATSESTSPQRHRICLHIGLTQPDTPGSPLPRPSFSKE